MSEWISVNDRLPESKLAICAVRVLAAACRDVTEANFYFEGRRWEACSSRKTIHPTHWQPLPDPPPKPDAFMEWYNVASLSNVRLHPLSWYREIWDAAIASTEKP